MKRRSKTSGKKFSGTVSYRRKVLGQHFLKNNSVAGAIIDALGPLDRVHVLEIGAGRGVLTYRLAEEAARLTALEFDRRLCEELARKLKDKDSVEVLHQDILEFDIDSWASACAPLTPVIVGNIPYRITSELLYKLIGGCQNLSVAVFMLQEEVARKLTALPGGKPYGLLSVMSGYRAAVEYLFFVGRSNFSPSPKVDSAVVRLDFGNADKIADDEKMFEFLVRRLFRDRRKQIQKILRTDPRFKLSGIRLEELAGRTGIDLSRRPEELSVKQFIALAAELNNSK